MREEEGLMFRTADLEQLAAAFEKSSDKGAFARGYLFSGTEPLPVQKGEIKPETYYGTDNKLFIEPTPDDPKQLTMEYYR